MFGEGKRVEQREKERTEVVRTFLFQSINEARIDDEQDLAVLNFTQLILLQKDAQAENPGQLMPVGGKIKDRETAIQAGLRETVEETHLRPSKRSLIEFKSVQDYQFRHSKRGLVKNRSHFLAGRLLPEPLDIPYGIDPEEDKIKDFVSLSLAQGRELFQTGQVGQEELLDSLVDEKVGVRAELFSHWQRIEAQKKMEVLDALLKMKYDGPEIKQQVKELISDLDKSEARVLEAIELWQRLINYFTVDEVRLALAHDNFKAKLEYATDNFDPATGQGVPTVEFILPLIMGEDLDFAEKKILMANPVTAKTLRMLQELHRAQEEDIESEEILERLREKELLDLVRESYQMERGKLVREEMYFDKLGQLIDRFFAQAEKEAGVELWDQLEEVKWADIKTLFGYASGNLGSERLQTERDKRVLKWEAQRKIIMITLLNEVIRFNNEILTRGIGPIEDLEKSLVDPRLRLSRGPQNLLLESASSERGMMRWHQPVRYSQVSMNGRVKSRRSLFRKMVVRDEVRMNPDKANDTFAGTIIFNRVDPKDLVIQEWAVPYNNEASKNYLLEDREGGKLKSFKAPKVIADLMFSFWSAGQGQVEIIDYKELPPQGQGFPSSGAGGEALLRFAKFYIRHTDEQGVIRHKEYHLFVPDEKRYKSAEDEYVDKFKDDKDYQMRRLFRTKGLRSLVELLFPAEIYGEDIKHIVKGKTS